MFGQRDGLHRLWKPLDKHRHRPGQLLLVTERMKRNLTQDGHDAIVEKTKDVHADADSSAAVPGGRGWFGRGLLDDACQVSLAVLRENRKLREARGFKLETIPVVIDHPALIGQFQ